MMAGEGGIEHYFPFFSFYFRPVLCNSIIFFKHNSIVIAIVRVTPTKPIIFELWKRTVESSISAPDVTNEKMIRRGRRYQLKEVR